MANVRPENSQKWAWKHVFGVALLCGAAGLGCDGAPTTPPPPPPASAEPSPPAVAPGEPNVIDDFFLSLRRELPAPETLSQQNGPSLECGPQGWTTYTLLDATAAKVPLEDPSNLARLVPWCRDENVCVRHTALSAAVSHLGYDRNKLVLPHMHDPEHFIYHDIMRLLQARLDEGGTRYDPAVFDGLVLVAEDEDFAKLVHGSWTQDVDPKTRSFVSSLSIDASEIRITDEHTTPDPKWPDHTWTTEIAEVTRNEQGHYIVTGAWDRESNAKGYRGEKIEPSQFTYSFLPVAEGIVWWKGGSASYWTKLRRAEP